MSEPKREDGRCSECEKAAKHAFSDATTPGFFYSRCEKHRLEDGRMEPSKEIVAKMIQAIIETDHMSTHERAAKHILKAMDFHAHRQAMQAAQEEIAGLKQQLTMTQDSWQKLCGELQQRAQELEAENTRLRDNSSHIACASLTDYQTIWDERDSSIARAEGLEARVKELEISEIEWTQFSGRLNTDIKFHSERADRLQAEVERLTIEVRNTQAARSMLAEKYDALDLRFKKASREPSFMNMVNFMTVTEERDTLTQQLAELRVENERWKIIDQAHQQARREQRTVIDGTREALRKMHGHVETLAHSYRGYLPDDDSDADTRTRLMLIKGTLDKADEEQANAAIEARERRERDAT